MNTRIFALFVLGIACAGCVGKIGDNPMLPGKPRSSVGSGDPGGGDTDGGVAACLQAGPRRVRRLSQREYFNVVRDLLGPDAATQAVGMLPPEPNIAGFDNQDISLRVSSAFQEGIANVAEKLSQAIDVGSLAPCDVVDGSAACLEAFAKAFARKAYGRAVTADEIERLLTAALAGDSYATSVQLIVETVLQSPYMLYATELGPDAPASAPTALLTSQEIASRLSLLITGARPDDELLNAADEGRLSTPDELTIAVDRLLATPRASEQIRLLIKGWLNLGPIAEAPKSSTAFPEFTPEVAGAMQEEVDAFIDSKISGGEGTFRSLLTDTSTHIPAALAPIYGAELTTQDGIPTLDPRHRRGILSLPGWLTYHAADQHSGPVERGLTVRRQLFCTPVAPPPPDVVRMISQHPVDPNDKAKTTRQKYEGHKTEKFCASCHDQFDSIGFGLEEMDGIGRYRTTENDLPVDSSGALVGTDVDGPFTGVAELSEKVATSTAFEACFIWQFFRFAESRVPEASEQCVVDAWSTAFAASGGHFRDLLIDYVTRPEFAVRKEDR